MKLPIKTSFFCIVFSITSRGHAEIIRIINEANTDAYIATAHYRPFLKRIDSEFPVENIQKIAKNSALDIEKPIKRGLLLKDIIIIAALNKDSLAFLDEIAEKQKTLWKTENTIKTFNFTEKFTNPEFKKLKEEKDLLKKDLEKSEKMSNKKILSTITHPITDNRTYILKTNSSNVLVIESKKELITPKLHRYDQLSVSLTDQIRPTEAPIIEETNKKKEGENNAKIREKISPNSTTNVRPNVVLPPADVRNNLATYVKLSKIKNTNEEIPPAIENSQVEEARSSSSTSSIANTAWNKAAQFRAADTSWIINGTGNALEINQVHSQILASLPSPSSDSIIIPNNQSINIKPIDIKLLKWRYLLYRKVGDKEWRSLWMWPVWDAYIFDQNNKIHKYSYAKRDAVLTKDLTTEATVYAAVYKYTKGKGALRTTPVTAIIAPETAYEIPYFSNFEQFGYRQLVISNNQSSLAININEAGYNNLVKKNIPLSIRQPHFIIAELQNNQLALYDSNEWEKVIKNLTPPKDPITLDWVENFILNKSEKLLGAIGKKLE